MQNASLSRIAAEAMALRARECQTTVSDLFTGKYEVSFDVPGHTDDERIEKTLDVTPELIERADAILRVLTKLANNPIDRH